MATLRFARDAVEPRASGATPFGGQHRGLTGGLFQSHATRGLTGPVDRATMRAEAYLNPDLEGISVAETPDGPWRPLRDEPWLADVRAIRALDQQSVRHAVREDSASAAWAAPSTAAVPVPSGVVPGPPVGVPEPPPPSAPPAPARGPAADRGRAVLIGAVALCLGVIVLTIAWVLLAT